MPKIATCVLERFDEASNFEKSISWDDKHHVS